MKTAHFLLLMLACATVRGQSFIEVIPESESLSGSSQYALYEAKKNSGLFESVTPVRIGDTEAGIKVFPNPASRSVTVQVGTGLT